MSETWGLFAMRERRSLLNFAILIIVAVGTTVFLLIQANEAIVEIERLNTAPAYLGLRSGSTDGGAAITGGRHGISS